MKLNVECIRDILLCVEESELCNGFQYFYFNAESEPLEYLEDEEIANLAINKFPRLSKYSEIEIYYHIMQCEASGLTGEILGDCRQGLTVCDLSPDGHELLGNIRSGILWSKVKSVLSKTGVETISAFINTASAVAMNSLANKL